jgi:hypothetical protein
LNNVWQQVINKVYIQGYNVQTIIDLETHIIIAADLSNQVADSPSCIDILELAATYVGK